MNDDATIQLELKNYRPFRDSRPARITVRTGETALVGVNNAGKSALLRFFYEFRNVFGNMTPGSSFLSGMLQGNAQAFAYPNEVQDPSDVFNNQTRRSIQITLKVTGALDSHNRRADAPHEGEGLIMEFPVDSNQVSGFLLVRGQSEPVRMTGFVNDSYHVATNVGIVNLADVLEAARLLSDTLYIGSFRNAINIGTRERYYDIEIGQSFIQKWKHLLTGTRKADNQAALGLMENLRQVFEFSSFTINASEDEQSLQFFINGHSYRLNELGAGLAQFVVGITNAAVRRPSFVLIDEPELNLHPKLQLEFLTLLGTHAKEGVIFATHAMGLARAGGDRVYSIRRIGDGDSEVRPLEGVPDLIELLGELGFSAYEDLGYSGIMLVEGPTDLKAMQSFLRLYGKEQKYVTVPLGGGQLINVGTEHQLAELARLGKATVGLIDSERTAENEDLSPARAEFARISAGAGVRLHVLRRRALENYFTERALTAAFGRPTRALELFEKLNSHEQNWPKADNWKAARETTRAELDATDLGEFLATL